MSAEHFGSGTIPKRSDTRRFLIAKRLIKLGGTAQRSDTVRLLEAKVLKVLNGSGSSSAGI